jgi:hypothetical protein
VAIKNDDNKVIRLFVDETISISTSIRRTGYATKLANAFKARIARLRS